MVFTWGRISIDFALRLCLIFNLLLLATTAKRLSMKIVEEPANYGLNNFDNDATAQGSSMQARVPPSNFSGPSHLRRLLSKCYTMLDDTYRYEFCPFQNLTQHEQSLRWNPYSGILGIWQEWEIENNTFVAMRMENGDSCGQIFRSARILFVCGDVTKVSNVTEPYQCHYEVTFKTPLVCHPHSMLVYPSLDQTLRDRWDSLEGQLQTQLLTVKGYKKQLRKIFEEAGYNIPLHMKQSNTKPDQDDTSQAGATDGHFESLSKCTEEYEKLKHEIEGLQTLLTLYGHSPDKNTTKTDKH